MEPGHFHRLPGDFCLWPPSLKGASRVILGNFVVVIFLSFFIVQLWKSETHYVDRPFFKLMEISLPLQETGIKGLCYSFYFLKHGFL